MNIKAGIKLDITSWENDGDNYKTKSFYGLGEAEVRFYVEFCKLFNSHNGDGDTECFGNIYDADDLDWDALINKVKAVIDKEHSGFAVLQSEWDMILDDEDDWKNFICELTGKLMSSTEDCYFRAYEGYKAYYIPIEIKEIKLEPSILAK